MDADSLINLGKQIAIILTAVGGIAAIFIETRHKTTNKISTGAYVIFVIIVISAGVGSWLQYLDYKEQKKAAERNQKNTDSLLSKSSLTLREVQRSLLPLTDMRSAIVISYPLNSIGKKDFQADDFGNYVNRLYTEIRKGYELPALTARNKLLPKGTKEESWVTLFFNTYVEVAIYRSKDTADLEAPNVKPLISFVPLTLPISANKISTEQQYYLHYLSGNQFQWHIKSVIHQAGVTKQSAITSILDLAGCSAVITIKNPFLTEKEMFKRLFDHAKITDATLHFGANELRFKHWSSSPDTDIFQCRFISKIPEDITTILN